MRPIPARRRHPERSRFSGGARDLRATSLPSDITNVIRTHLPSHATIILMDSPIDLKHIIQRIPFKIEPKPGGGFIAHATDPTVQPIEAPTREELHQKILAAVSAEFPELGIPGEGKKINVSLLVKTSNGGFSFSSNPDASARITNAADSVNPALEKLLGFAFRHLAPKLAKQVASQAGTASFKLTINEKTALGVNSTPQGLTLDSPKNPALPSQASDIPMLDAGTGTIDGRPITPEPNNLGRIFKFIVWAMILGVLAYLYLLSRH